LNDSLASIRSATSTGSSYDNLKGLLKAKRNKHCVSSAGNSRRNEEESYNSPVALGHSKRKDNQERFKLQHDLFSPTGNKKAIRKKRDIKVQLNPQVQDIPVTEPSSNEQEVEKKAGVVREIEAKLLHIEIMFQRLQEYAQTLALRTTSKMGYRLMSLRRFNALFGYLPALQVINREICTQYEELLSQHTQVTPIHPSSTTSASSEQSPNNNNAQENVQQGTELKYPCVLDKEAIRKLCSIFQKHMCFFKLFANITKQKEEQEILQSKCNTRQQKRIEAVNTICTRFQNEASTINAKSLGNLFSEIHLFPTFLLSVLMKLSGYFVKEGAQDVANELKPVLEALKHYSPRYHIDVKPNG